MNSSIPHTYFSPESSREPNNMSNRKLFAAIIFLPFIQQNVAQTALLSKADVEKRVDAILSQMTQEEKIEIIGGMNNFYTRPLPRHEIPSLRMSQRIMEEVRHWEQFKQMFGVS
jgi:hypothetical protein